jgi:hypothetical protein
MDQPFPAPPRLRVKRISDVASRQAAIAAITANFGNIRRPKVAPKAVEPCDFSELSALVAALARA